MPYKARFSRIFLRKKGRLLGDVKVRVVEALRDVLVNPHVGVALVGSLRGLWRVRVGKYRVLYEVDEKEKALVNEDFCLFSKHGFVYHVAEGLGADVVRCGRNLGYEG